MKIKTQIENKECYVAFLDILGFKEYVMKTPADEILKVFKELLQYDSGIKKDRMRIFRDSKTETERNILADNLYFYIMSDSIILAIEKKHIGGLQFLIKWCHSIQTKLFFENFLLLRGGISEGMFYGDGTINFGKGLISAYELEGKIAKYPRIIIESKVVKEASQLKVISLRPQLATAEDNGTYMYIDYLHEINWTMELQQKMKDNGFLKCVRKEQNNKMAKITVEEKLEWVLKYMKEKIEEYEEMIWQYEQAHEFSEFNNEKN